MNIGEANSVNTVLQVLFGQPNSLGERPSPDQVLVAAKLLAKGAHKAIMCGITEAQVAELHAAREARLADFRHLCDLAEDTSDMDSDIEVGRLSDVMNLAWRLLGLNEKANTT